jgi:hypothetical protein
VLYRGNAAYGCNAASCAIYNGGNAATQWPRHGGHAVTWRQCRYTYCILYIAAMPRQMIDAFMSMHACTHTYRGNAAVLYRGNAAYGCNAASCALCGGNAATQWPRHGGHAVTWRQCRDMAAMPLHVLHPVHRGNAAANDRRIHVYARMHTYMYTCFVIFMHTRKTKHQCR